jgi:CRISPR type III-A-associated protein Csm2
MSELEQQQNPPEPAEVQAAPPAEAPEAPPAEAPAPAVDAPAPALDETPAPAAETAEKPAEKPVQKPGGSPERRERPAGRPDRGERGERGERPRGSERGPERGGDRGGERRGPRGPERGRGPEISAEIDIEKLVGDSLYLDNQAHAIVARMRDMDSGTRSQLRRLYSAVRRACRAAEADRQHQFVMLRARLAYTIARHQLRSLDPLERLLLQVTRRNDARGYERFRDLFEAIVAYNE